MRLRSAAPVHHSSRVACSAVEGPSPCSKLRLEPTDALPPAPRSYGRPEYCTLLLDAGASTAARNDTGKTPLDLAKLNSANPINAEPEVLKRLSGTGGFFQDV